MRTLTTEIHRPPEESFHQAMPALDDFFVVNQNKVFNQRSNCRWFESPWGSYDPKVNVSHIHNNIHFICFIRLLSDKYSGVTQIQIWLSYVLYYSKKARIFYQHVADSCYIRCFVTINSSKVVRSFMSVHIWVIHIYVLRWDIWKSIPYYIINYSASYIAYLDCLDGEAGVLKTYEVVTWRRFDDFFDVNPEEAVEPTLELPVI